MREAYTKSESERAAPIVQWLLIQYLLRPPLQSSFTFSFPNTYESSSLTSFSLSLLTHIKKQWSCDVSTQTFNRFSAEQFAVWYLIHFRASFSKFVPEFSLILLSISVKWFDDKKDGRVSCAMDLHVESSLIAVYCRKADIALIGLAVMGQNLILNMNDNGFKVCAFNRTVDKVRTVTVIACSAL